LGPLVFVVEPGGVAVVAVPGVGAVGEFAVEA